MEHYLYLEDSSYKQILLAASLDDAKVQARELLLEGSWPPGWVEARVWRCDEDGEPESVVIDATVAVFVEPPEPKCPPDDPYPVPDEHDWRGHPRIGLDENPGCMGIGGAAIQQTDVCLHCGLVRVTIAGDTNPVGAGNRDGTWYEDPIDTEELAAVRAYYTYADPDE